MSAAQFEQFVTAERKKYGDFLTELGDPDGVSAAMRLWLLGTGTPTPSLRRMCSGYLLQVGADYLVFDHGFGAHHRLLELGFAATQVSHAFFSHHHYDHIGDYPRLLLTRWDQGAGGCPSSRCTARPGMEAITRAPDRR